MTDISKRSALNGINRRITLADDPSWGDLDGLELADGYRIFYAPAIQRNFSPGSRNTPSYNGGFKPLGLCFHSAEEDADDAEVTPWWFQQHMGGKRVASTNFYADNDGDLFQMVRVQDFAYAQGCAKEYDRLIQAGGRPSWMRQWPLSYNTFLISIEQEFHAATVTDETFSEASPMFDTEARWAAFMHRKYDIPLLPERWVTHEELCTYKGDPGDHWRSLKPKLMAKCEHYFHGDVATPTPQLAVPAAPSTDLEAEINALKNARAVDQQDITQLRDEVDKLLRWARDFE